MHKPQAKSSFAVIGEQRVVVSDQLARVKHFRAKIADSCSTLTLSLGKRKFTHVTLSMHELPYTFPHISSILIFI